MNEVKRIIEKDISLKDYLDSIYIPKKVINDLVNNKLIRRNDTILNLNDQLYKNDIISFFLEEYDKNDISDFGYNLDIVYEDDDILIIKKGRKILIHSDGNSDETLLNAVSKYMKDCDNYNKPRCVHRIDYDTIGLVMFSKNLISYYYMFYQMNNNLIKKKYYALVEGKLDSGRIEKPIGSDRHNNNRYLVSKSGKNAITIYNQIEYKNNKSLMDIEIITGRRHQIRVHMAYLSHPIVGDKIYGKGENLMLENYYLGFSSPKNNKFKEVKIKNELEF